MAAITTSRWVNGLALALAALLAVAACSGSSNTAAPKATRGPSSTTPTIATGPSTPATASVPGTTGVVPPTTTTPRPTANTQSACRPSQLAISTPGANGADGTGIYLFMVVNQRTTSCQVGAYFGVSIYDPAGHELTATATREPGNGTEKAVQAITLQAGGTASFTVTVNEIPSSGSSCPMIGAFHLTPPNATVYLQVSLRPSGHQYCGQPEVFPTQPGTP